VLERERATGRETSCRAGCGACCRQLVVISVIEAESLARLVAQMPEERAAVIRGRFAEAVKRLEEAGLLDAPDAPGERPLIVRDMGELAISRMDVARRYFALGIPCPFLEAESCGIHADRPMVCREYHVTSLAEDCALLCQKQVARVESPLHVGDALARTAAGTMGTEVFTIPLVLSLEWSAAKGAAMDVRHDGRELLGMMVGELGRKD